MCRLPSKLLPNGTTRLLAGSQHFGTLARERFSPIL